MKFFKSPTLFIALGIAFFSFSCESESNQRDDSKMLFKTVPVSVKGDKILFADKPENIRKEIERIFVHKNHLLNKLESYGFAKDDVGVNYFYVKEVLPSGARKTIAFFLKDLAEIGNQSNLKGTTCVNEECCSECVPHSQLICTCFDYDDECYGSGKSAKCVESGGGSVVFKDDSLAERE